MIQDYFLGANTAEGFYSLYGGFPPQSGAFLHILKGGPGTGKSSMLRAIAAAANARGMEVQRVLCSGDPDSLDGVFLPALGLAWADGTAPHVLEPALFGASGDYVNLGAFFVSPFMPEEREQAIRLREAYQGSYRRAYGFLAACQALGGGRTADCPDATLRRRLNELPDRGGAGRLTKRFARAICCKGLIPASKALNGFQTESAPSAALSYAAAEAQRKGWDVILCLSPLCPREAETLLLPGPGLAFTAIPDPTPASREPLAQAMDALRKAKALHDELEALYRPHMDFAGLTVYTEQLLLDLFPPEE